MTSSRRVLMLTSSYPRWPGDSTCEYLRHFAEQLTKEFAVTVLTPPSQGAASIESQNHVSIIRFRYGLFRWAEVIQSGSDSWSVMRRRWIAVGMLPLYLICFFWQAWRLARQADVIVSHWLVPSGLIGAAISWLNKKPHVAIEHSGALRLLSTMPGGCWIARFIIAHSCQVVTVSEELRQRLIELVPEAEAKSETIPMGVDVDEQMRPGEVKKDDLSVEPEGRHVLYLGRLTDVKGVAYLIRAMHRISKAALIIAGDGEGRASLQALSRESGTPIEFVGWVDADQRRALLRACDVVVIPSVALANGQTEGTPVVCLEAMAAGKAIIASRVGGIPEVIRDGVNGFLVEPASVEALRQTLERVLGDERLRRRVGLQARRTAQQFAWPRIGQRYCRLIHEVAA